MRFFLLALMLLATVYFFGCATPGKDRQGVPPPSPIEAQLLAQAIMAVGLESKKDFNVEDLQKVRAIIEEARVTLLFTLAENPTELPTVGKTFIKGINPAYQTLINAVVGVLIVRIGPAIDKGKTALAAEYVHAVLTGANQAILDRLEFETSSNRFYEQLVPPG